MPVKVYFDFVCPYCYLGRGFWLKMQQECPVEAEWIPWEIHPEFPPTGGERKDASQALASLEKNRKLGEGIRHFEMNHVSPNTHKALLGLEYVRAREEEKTAAYIERFFRAMFVEDVDFSLLPTVLQLGEEVELNRVNLQKSIEKGEYEDLLVQHDREAESMNLEVVPSFVQDGKLMLAGSTTMDFMEFREKYLKLWGR